MPAEWACTNCGEPQTHERYCQACDNPRFASWAVMVAQHVTEHIADGCSTPLEVLKQLLTARTCYAKAGLTLAFVAQQMRLLTKDTTTLARQIAKARASRVMLEVLETGDAKDKIAVLKGIQVLGDVIEHKGEVTTRFVVETHEGSPPARSEP